MTLEALENKEEICKNWILGEMNWLWKGEKNKEELKRGMNHRILELVNSS